MFYRVYNPSTLEIEQGEKMTCPRCDGHGAKTGDERKGGNCTLCGGDGRVIRNIKSGATRRITQGLNTSQIW